MTRKKQGLKKRAPLWEPKPNAMYIKKPHPPSSSNNSFRSATSYNQKRPKYDLSPSNKQPRYVKRTILLQKIVPESDKDSWRQAPKSSLPNIFHAEIDECSRMLKRVDKKIKCQKKKQRKKFLEDANNAARKIAFAFKFYLFKLRIYERVRTRRAIQIQCWIRSCFAKGLVKTVKAARLIQKYWRGVLARKYVIMYRETRTEAVITIQCWIRICFAKQKAKTMLPFPLNIIRIHNERMAALKLQRALKSFVLRQKGKRFILVQKASKIKVKIDSKKNKRIAQETNEINNLLNSYNTINEKRRASATTTIIDDNDNKKRSSSDEHAKDVEAQDETIHHRHDSLSHHATVGGVLSQIGLIYEKKAKQDKLDRKHGRKHPPLNEIIEDFFIDHYGTTLGRNKCFTFLNEVKMFHAQHVRIRWFILFLDPNFTGSNTNDKKKKKKKKSNNLGEDNKIIINMKKSPLRFPMEEIQSSDKCFFPYVEKAIGVYMRALLAMVEDAHKIHENFKEEDHKTDLHKAKLACRRAFNENEDITIAQIQEKLIASIEESLGKNRDREYDAKLSIDEILDMCLRQWYANEIVDLTSSDKSNSNNKKNNDNDNNSSSETSLHLVYTKATEQHYWKMMKCQYCGMRHQQPIEKEDKDSPPPSDVSDKDWDLPLVVEPWKFEEFEDDVLDRGVYRGINHSRVTFKANRRNVKRKIEKFLDGKAIIPIEPVCLRQKD